MKVVALSGGVGGARLLDGLARALPAGSLTAVVNTGDDFVHLGHERVARSRHGHVHARRASRTRSAAGASPRRRSPASPWSSATAGPTGSALGDRDLATHLLRTEALRAGEPLSAITARLCGALGIAHPILPMSDHPVRTMIETAGEGTLPFQQWFVRRRAEPPVRAVRFEGGRAPAPGVLDGHRRVRRRRRRARPTRTSRSIPILCLDGVRDAIARKPVVALSPIVGGAAIKGPLATMIRELTGEARSGRRGRPALPRARARDGRRAAATRRRSRRSRCSARSTVMRSRDDRLRLAREILAFAREAAR